MTDNQLVLGDVSITRVQEMHGPIMSPGEFFPTIPPRSWLDNESHLAPDHLDVAADMIQVAMQTWVLRSEGQVILVDTGVGNDKSRVVEPWDHLTTDFIGALAAAGIRAEDVDLVINTHLHVDHVGWNTSLRDGEWVPTFPNATYLMPRADFEFWNPAERPAADEGVNRNVYADSVAPVHAAGQVQLWEGEHRVDGALRLESAPGHTPGMSVLKLQSGTDTAVFCGDLMHSPLQVTEVEHNSCFCEDPDQARASRRKVLGWAAEQNAVVFPAHFSGQGALTVGRRDDSFSIGGWADLGRL